MRSVTLLCGAGIALGLGACAALSGLSSYASGDCSEGCDANAGELGGEASTDADATMGTVEASASNGEAGQDVATEDTASRGLDGSVDVADVESDSRVPETGGADTGMQDASVDGTADGAADTTTDAVVDGGSEAGSEAGADAGDLGVGLVAYYKFDETSGTTAADSSGNNRTATLVGAATFSSGLQNNAVSLDGQNSYVALPAGIVGGLTAFSISAWVNLNAPLATWSRVFDFGTGTTTYLFLTANSNANAPRFSITNNGFAQEQQLNATTALATGSWQHIAVTLAANTGTLYVGGTKVTQNTGMTVNPANLGSTTQNWLGRSEFVGDPYLSGKIDNFRIYSRALSAADVQALYSGHL